jgi:hypothetical protein
MNHTVPGVPSLVSSRKMTLKPNHIYMKALQMHKYCSPPQKPGTTFLLKLIIVWEREIGTLASSLPIGLG